MSGIESGSGHETGSATQSDPRSIVIEVRELSKSYGSIRALTDVNFIIWTGEVVGLVGDNGAGKSTLIKCLSGAIVPDSGFILTAGNDHVMRTASDARDVGIETVYQDLALIETFDLTDNFFLGREVTHSGCRLIQQK